jgi:CheY-like chemotaxis protein
MPTVDGFELCKELSKLDPDINACMHAPFLTASEQHYENFRNEDHRALDKKLFLRSQYLRKAF